MVDWIDQVRDMKAGLSRDEPDFLFTQLIKNKHTLLMKHQLSGLWTALHSIRKVPGVLVECGVMKGGASIVMALANKKFLGERDQWMFDTWAGFPADEDLRYGRGEGHDRKLGEGMLRVSLETCLDNFAHYGAFNGDQHFVKGAFKDTTKGWDEPVALLRIDGDLYSSTRECLENIYPFVVKGGVVIIDDYLFDDCKKATDEYREKHGIKNQIYLAQGRKLKNWAQNMSYAGVWWRKS